MNRTYLFSCTIKIRWGLWENIVYNGYMSLQCWYSAAVLYIFFLRWGNEESIHKNNLIVSSNRMSSGSTGIVFLRLSCLQCGIKQTIMWYYDMPIFLRTGIILDEERRFRNYVIISKALMDLGVEFQCQLASRETTRHYVLFKSA